MNCAVCGTALVPGARFCYQCGTPQDASGVENAERRRVTVLFGDLSDFTSWAEDLDPERVGVVTDRVLAALAQVVNDVGGHVDKLTGDGIMAVFGAPVAHEDDAERALRAAAAMQEQVARLVADESGGGRRLGLRVGLNTGVVLAGVQGQLSYTVVGDTVNTASRLSDAASVGAVYAGRDTALETSRVAVWRELAPLRLKGKRKPVEAYEFVSLRVDGSGRPGFGDGVPLVGREAELGTLVGQLRAVVEEHRPGRVQVAGEAGIGKSRIVTEFARVAQETHGVRVLWGHCSPYGQDSDLEPFAQVVRTVCGIGVDDRPPEARERVVRTVARLEPYDRSGWPSGVLEERLFSLLGIEENRGAGDREWPRDTVPPLQRANPQAIDALNVLVSTLAAQTPVVTIFEDVHYARAPMIEAFGEFTKALTGPVLVVAVCRSHDGSTTVFDAPGTVPLTVGPLDPSTLDRLLRAYLGGAVLPTRERGELVAWAGGNPFFLAELLELLRDQGVLVQDGDGFWMLTGRIPHDALPAGVRSVLAARIDALEPAARALLRDASVFGTAFASAWLPQVDPRVDLRTVEALLQSVADHGLVVGTGQGRWRFAHSLARDVAYEALTKSERARRHAAVATMAPERRARPAEVDAAVAAQAEQAVTLATEMALPGGDPAWSAVPAGVEAGLRLGRSALRQEDNVAAERALVKALQLVRPVQAAGLVPADEVRYGEVMYASALNAQHRPADVVERELDGPLASERPDIRAGALIVLGELRSRGGDREGARNALVRAFALAGDSGQDELTGIAMRRLGLLDLLDGRLVSAEDRFRQALALARQVHDDYGAAWALQHLTWCAATRVDFDAALRALDEARACFRSFQDAGGAVWCDGSEAFVRLLQGQLQAARALVAEVLPVVEGMGARWEAAVCRWVDAMAALSVGEMDSAVEELAQAARSFAGLDEVWGPMLVAFGNGMVFRASGEVEAAVAAFEDAERAASRQQHRPLQMTALAFLALLFLDVGDVGGIEAVERRMIALRFDFGAFPEAFSGLTIVSSRIRYTRGDLAGAEQLLRGALAGGTSSLLFPRRQALAYLAKIQAESGNTDEAFVTIDRALAEPAEDVRSQIGALTVYAQLLIAAGRRGEAAQAAREVVDLAAESGHRGFANEARQVLEVAAD